MHLSSLLSVPYIKKLDISGVVLNEKLTGIVVKKIVCINIFLELY